MSAAEASGTLKRLRWRCRRGTRELDALLGGWLDEHGAHADAQTLAAFDALLGEPDPLIWDWLMGYERAPHADRQEIVDAIRARHRL
ncbi:MAG TPA: succinate dehydrogenase assembly factor 2 [Rhodanobacteraceae bacterium]